MDRLTSIGVFVAAVDEGSLAAAARRFGLSPAMAGKYVSALEAQLNTRLLQRTTRRLHLTEAGQRYHERCRHLLQAFDEANREASASQGIAHGKLRVSAPVTFGAMHLGPAVARYLADNPRVDVDVLLEDRYTDLLSAGVDVAIRIGRLADSTLVARRIAPCRMVVCASPAYLQRHGTPLHPDKLAGHRCIGWRRAPEVAPHRWEFTEAGRAFAVEVAPQVTTNDLHVMLRTALADGGITFAPEDCFRPWLASGALVPVLLDYVQAFPGFFLYYPSRHNPPPKLRALIAHVRAFNDSV